MASEIYSSVGGNGFGFRQYDRGYLNNGVQPVSVDFLSQSMGRVNALVERKFESGRAVVRTAASDGVVQQLFTTENELFPHLEAAIPYGCVSSGERSWLLMFGKNAPNRTPNEPPEMLQARIAEARAKHPPLPASEHIARVVGNGYRFSDQVTPGLEEQLYDLWSETFGWEPDDILGLQRRLEREAVIPGEKRTVWFTGILRGDELVSAAMAERLTMKTEHGQLNVVENTEWKTKKGNEGQGLVTTAVAGTNVKVIRDLSRSNLLLVAECNIHQGSISSAHKASMDIAPQFYTVSHSDGTTKDVFIPQIVEQNVGVNDGLNLPSKLRDFGVYVLGEQGRAQNYSPAIIERSLALMG